MLINILKTVFFGNYLLALGIIGWCAAQALKTVIYFAINRKFSAERLVGAGGWPSSHASLVCSVLVGTAKHEGLSSPLFAIMFVFAMVVMYDAMGVRREAGNQARVLNRLLEQVKKAERPQDMDYGEQLKEMVGHTPFQVFSGAMLGILIALVVPMF